MIKNKKMEAKTLTSATPNYDDGVSEASYQDFCWKLQAVYKNYKTMPSIP